VQLAEQGKQSNVISATLEDTNRDRLRRILDEIGAQYVRQNVERKAAEAEKTIEFLDKQLPEFKKQLEGSEDAYAISETRTEPLLSTKRPRPCWGRQCSCRPSCSNPSNCVATCFLASLKATRRCA
jgi:hypothetical protein